MSVVPARSDRSRAASAAGGWLVVCGVVLLAWPAATIRVVVLFVGLGAIGVGVHELVRVFGGARSKLGLWSGLIGLANLLGGIVVMIAPFVSLDAARLVVGVYWLVAGLIETVGSLARPDGRLERFSVGVLSLAAAAAALVPAVPGTALVWLAGAWLVVVGLVVLALGRIAASSAG